MAWNGSLMFASSVGGLVAIFVLLNWVPLALLTCWSSGCGAGSRL